MSKLKEYRESKGIKQIAVASHLGITRQTYASYEDRPEAMSVEQAQAVCNFLNCEWGDIFLPQQVN